MRTPVEAQCRYGGPWKPAEHSDEGDEGPVVVAAGSDEPLGVGDVFAINADADSGAELIEAAREAGFSVVEE